MPNNILEDTPIVISTLEGSPYIGIPLILPAILPVNLIKRESGVQHSRVRIILHSMSSNVPRALAYVPRAVHRQAGRRQHIHPYYQWVPNHGAGGEVIWCCGVTRARVGDYIQKKP
ncbi:hypothetical protein EDC04DRAFT_3088706 [Pisolithus marmoratus]|nr:hypothetical protein EDC04DRAFT_3088706 [Pisolithus marmoratus]